MLGRLTAVLEDDQGQGLAEYGLILLLVSVVAVTALHALSTAINGTLTKVAADV